MTESAVLHAVILLWTEPAILLGPGLAAMAGATGWLVAHAAAGRVAANDNHPRLAPAAPRR